MNSMILDDDILTQMDLSTTILCIHTRVCTHKDLTSS